MEGLDDSILQVSQVFPEIDEAVIRTDLSFTKSAEQTINRILDGTIIQSSPGKNIDATVNTCSSTDINSDSDLDLPTLQSKVKSVSFKIKSNQTFKGSKEDSNDEVIDLSQEEDVPEVLSDTDVNSDSGTDLPDLDIKGGKSDIDDDQIDLTSDEIDLGTVDNTNTNSYSCSSNNRGFAKKFVSLDGSDSDTNTNNQVQAMYDIESEDSDSNDTLANRLGLAERCGLGGRKTDFLSNFTSASSKTSDPVPVDEDSNSCDVPPTKGVKRKGKTNMEDLGWPAATEMSEDAPAKKPKKKRTAEEIAESKQQAEEKRAAKQRVQEEKKAQKQREMEMRKAVQESKKHFRPGDCIKYVTVSVDPGVINQGQLGAGIFKVCGDLEARCVTENQLVPNTITWKREVLDCSRPAAVAHDVAEDDVLVMIPLQDFITMVLNYVQAQQGIGAPGSLTVKEFIQTLQSVYPGKTVSVFVVGKEKYFSDLKLANKRNHRDAVQTVGGTEGPRQKKSKTCGLDIVVTRVQMEEALIDAQLLTNCVVQFAETSQDAADLIKCFTKAVADKPAKKDRLENVFDFLAEGAAGVKVDKNGNGHLKVWKHQLMQFKSVGPDMAEAIISVYPSPRMLYEAYKKCSTEREGQKVLENIVVRRGAGVLVTNRRIGKELSRKIYSLFTSTDSHQVIK